MSIAPNYIYRCRISRCVDGDTVDAEIDLGFQIIHRARIRLHGIDTPESRTRNKKEKALGLASKARIKELIASAKTGKRGRKEIYLETSKEGKGKFGRILGTLWVDDGKGEFDVNQALIDEDHARAYFGGSKGELGPWVKQEDGAWYRWTHSGYVPYDD